MSDCSVCGVNKATRLNVCYECIEAESIIDDGLDMYDKPYIDGKTNPMSKLKYLISKGWRFNSVKPGTIRDITEVNIKSFKDRIKSFFCKHEYSASRTNKITCNDFDLIVKCKKCKKRYISKGFFK